MRTSKIPVVFFRASPSATTWPRDDHELRAIQDGWRGAAQHTLFAVQHIPATRRDRKREAPRAATPRPAAHPPLTPPRSGPCTPSPPAPAGP
jgi:hypothetical protein